MKIFVKFLILIIIIGVIIFVPKVINNYETTDNTIIENTIENSVQTDIVENDSQELFEEYYDEAEELLSTMTLEEKVGQMFLARFPEDGVIEEINEENPGGYILFARDFENETKSSMLQKLTACQDTSKIGLILGVDEEGGTVVRVSSFTSFRSSKFKSPQELWAEGGLSKIIEDSIEKSSLLKSIGLNMNLAPVADVSTTSSDFIYARSLRTRC